jgi:hypothetical protein
MAFPVDEKYITNAESELGVRFPDSFRERMKTLNGGEIDLEEDTWAIYPVFDKSDAKRIKRTSNHILHETKVAKEWNNFPVDAVAIGQNGFGDKLILLPEERSSIKLGEAIYLWSHETGDVTEICSNINELEP